MIVRDFDKYPDVFEWIAAELSGAEREFAKAMLLFYWSNSRDWKRPNYKKFRFQDGVEAVKKLPYYSISKEAAQAIEDAITETETA
jgi:hypothetical protein